MGREGRSRADIAERRRCCRDPIAVKLAANRVTTLMTAR